MHYFENYYGNLFEWLPRSRKQTFAEKVAIARLQIQLGFFAKDLPEWAYFIKSEMDARRYRLDLFGRIVDEAAPIGARSSYGSTMML